jgi:hypothetical protein
VAAIKPPHIEGIHIMARKASFIASPTQPEAINVQELSFETARNAAQSFVGAKQGASDLAAKAASAADIILCEMVSGFLLSAKVTIGNPKEADFAEYTFADMGNDFEGSRKVQGAFKDACLSWLGVNRQHGKAGSLWAELKGQFKVAVAARNAGMSAEIVDGKVKLSGGTGPIADALANADSSNKRKGAIAPEAGGKAERDRAEKDEGREATPSEVTSAAAAIARHVASGKVTVCSATMSNLRAIAKLVAAHPELFADD